MRHNTVLGSTVILIIALLSYRCEAAYNDLSIPDTLSGRTFNLVIRDTFAQYRSGNQTITGGVNGMTFWGPTLIFNQGDTIQLNVKNLLNDSTTIHWHGLHLPAVMDGGPHQIIPPGTTWQPFFKVANKAATYWYHPHLHEMTQEHLTKGIGGFIIIRDSIESRLNLPRTYGVDDIPIVFTSRRFDASNQFDTKVAYGDYLLGNGVMNPQVTLPKQYVRLRILNGEIERAYNFGFSDNRTFFVITTDGGLLNSPVGVKRLRLAVGERAEILVDLSNDAIGSSLDLKAFNSGQAFGFPGGEPQTSGPLGSLLNNTDFVALHINVGAEHSPAIHDKPALLANDVYWTANDATVKKTVAVTDGTPGTDFTLDNKAYGFNRIDKITKLGDVEMWTVTNNQVFGHAFHIHDVQFKIVARNGLSNAVSAAESGWKDVVFLPRNESVSFVAKFDDYADSTHPFMYHCHFVNHEDGGMMGQFVVVDPGATMSLNPTSLVIPASTNLTKNFSISSNQSWTVNSDQSWLNVSQNSGTNNAIITCTATENTSVATRSALVSVRAANNTTLRVEVIQVGASRYLELSTAAVQLLPSGETHEVGVHTNTSWTAISDSAWCTVHPQSATGDTLLEITAPLNSTGAKRSTVVHVVGQGMSEKTLRVDQGVLTGVEEEATSTPFLVKPNPVDERLSIIPSSMLGDVYYVRVYALNGRCVLMIPRPKLEAGIDLHSLSPGTYSLELTESPSMKMYHTLFQKR